MQTIEIKIKDHSKIYQELAEILSPYREKPAGSILFVVEGTKKNPLIGLRYPGKKVKKRNFKTERANQILWANLYDFEVIPYKNGKEFKTQKFTFGELFKDFYQHKGKNKKFWSMLCELYNKSTITKKPPKLAGIDSKLYLLVLKWIWLQEDLNYRFNWQDINSPIKYVLETRTGNTTSKGAGRAKFFAALKLLKNDFPPEQIRKIIPLY